MPLAHVCRASQNTRTLDNHAESHPTRSTHNICVIVCPCILAVLTAVFCGWIDFNLACPSGTLQILTSSFGRSDHTTCPTDKFPVGSPQLDWWGPCRLDMTPQIVARCNGKSSCSNAFYLDWPAMPFGWTDPCIGTWKYSNITYTCDGATARGGLGLIQS